MKIQAIFQILKNGPFMNYSTFLTNTHIVYHVKLLIAVFVMLVAEAIYGLRPRISSCISATSIN